jgi:hypothetical protein
MKRRTAKKPKNKTLGIFGRCQERNAKFKDMPQRYPEKTPSNGSALVEIQIFPVQATIRGFVTLYFIAYV